MQNKERIMKYETPKIIKEEHIEVQQLVAGCGLIGGTGGACDSSPNQTASGS